MSYLNISTPDNQKTEFTSIQSNYRKIQNNQDYLKKLSNPNISTQELIEYLNKETAGLFVAEPERLRDTIKSIRDKQDYELFSSIRNNPSTNFDVYGRLVNANSNNTSNLAGDDPEIQMNRDMYIWRPLPIEGENKWYIEGKDGKIPKGLFM
jgi:hypothetical protein